MLGISLTQSGHHVAQKLTTVTLPRRSEVVKLSPASVAKRASGAVRCGVGRNAVKAPIATMARPAISLIAGFMEQLYEERHCGVVGGRCHDVACPRHGPTGGNYQ